MKDKIAAYIRRFIKFGVVGLSGTIIDFTITWLCRDIIGLYELLANAIGFVVAATSNYIFNRKWTWRSHEKQIGVEYLKFFTVSVIGLGINTLILTLLRHILHFHNDNLDFWVAKVGATAVVMMWNFLANNFFTFRKHECRPQAHHNIQTPKDNMI